MNHGILQKYVLCNILNKVIGSITTKKIQITYRTVCRLKKYILSKKSIIIKFKNILISVITF